MGGREVRFVISLSPYVRFTSMANALKNVLSINIIHLEREKPIMYLSAKGLERSCLTVKGNFPIKFGR